MINEQILPINTDSDIITARQRGRAMAAELGFSGTDQALIATAISELARNVIEYAKKGEVLLSVAEQGKRRGIKVIVRDRGPGIADVQQAMQDHFSTGKSLGLGLPGSKRLMDEFDIASEVGKGTTITVKKWLR